VSFKQALTLPKDSRGVVTILASDIPTQTSAYDFNVFSCPIKGDGKNTAMETYQLRLKWSLGRSSSAGRLSSTTILSGTPKKRTGCLHQSCSTRRYVCRGGGGRESIRTHLCSQQGGPVGKLPASEHSHDSKRCCQHAGTIHAAARHPPPILDGVIQICVPLFQQHSIRGAVMPLLLGNMLSLPILQTSKVGGLKPCATWAIRLRTRPILAPHFF
jgi:hypothetical protein